MTENEKKVENPVNEEPSMDENMKEKEKAKEKEASTEKQIKKDKKENSKKLLEEKEAEIEALKKELEKKDALAKEGNDKYLRMMAEYENFRKRAEKEKDATYNNALTDVLTEILPVIDTLELALKYNSEGSDDNVVKGVEMTLTKFNEVLAKLGVTPVETKTFDPEMHNAVMHTESEEYGEGEIIEVFQKGYKKDDKIIRYAMVSVAN